MRKDSGGSWTEYVYWNGAPLAEKNADGSWSDYIYANGQRMARADSYDQRIHISGTSTAAGSYAGWYLPFASYTIQAGDRIGWRQYQAAARGGIGISFAGGGSTNWTTKDTGGQVMNSDTVENAWQNRVVDLTPFAGKTVANLWVTADAATPVGSWHILYGELAIYSADGTVRPIYERAASAGFTYFTGGGETNAQALVELSNQAADAEQPGNTTSYYVEDHLGSARMLLAAGGWPVSAENYYPYGVEQAAPADPNHYKFTDKERDSESGNDDFGARYYAGTMGRFLSPDWSATPQAMPYADLTNPQSFNRYAYVNGNPLSGRDLDGHCDQSLLPTLLDMIPYVAVEEHPVCKNPPAGNPNQTQGQKLYGAIQATGKAADQAISAASDYVNSHPLLAGGLAVGAALTGNSQDLEEEAPAIENALEGAVSSAESTLESAGSDLVNLASSERTQHILYGDETGGGHLSGTGISGKSEFPSGWSAEQVMHNISDVVTNPASRIRLGGRGETATFGTVGGVDIKVVTRGGLIVTAYSTNTPKNP